MGLDMYLIKKIHIGGKYAENGYENLVVIKGNGSHRTRQIIKIRDIDDIEKNVIYWRKNYAINEWFLDKVNDGGDDNCRYFYVDKRDLEELRDICREIYFAKTKEEKKAIAIQKLNTDDLEEYFDDYISEFERTYKELNDIINSADYNDADFYYYIWY